METVDIITPLVDDPFTFGRIAAANALSDVYAMGAKPVTAMNLVFFPACSLEGSVLKAILEGGLSAIREAGACLVGGHTVEDDELKYGLSVTGLIDPDLVLRNSTARPGDLLVLTKPLGTGIVSTAIKADMISATLETEAIRWMTTLNAGAAAMMKEYSPSSVTDITGFGFLGHLCEMAQGAETTMRLTLKAVPVMDGVAELVLDGLVPAGCYRNRDHYAPLVKPSAATETDLFPLYDPQTSGGLLMAFKPADAERFVKRAVNDGCFAVVVGEVLPRGEFPLELV